MIKSLLSSIMVFVLTLTIQAQELPKFKDGQTICFIGNSITQAGTYHMLLQSYYATRYPGNKVKFISCGVSGDNAPGMIARFEKDILIHKPDYAFLMTGMNDMYGFLFAPGINVDSSLLAKRENALSTYKKHTNKLAELMVSNNIKPIFMTPSIYDQTAAIATPANFGKNDALVRCAQHIRSLGLKYNAPVVDLNPFMLEINHKLQKKDPSFTIISQDRVHPQETGHFIMAHKIISTIFPAEKVSHISLHAKKNSIKHMEHCEIELIKGKKPCEFSMMASSLPFPINNSFMEAQKFVPFIETYNKEILQIAGLQKGEYILKIDDIAVDTLSSKELKKGINMATNPLTPQYLQATKVFDLCTKYHNIQSDIRVIALIQYRTLNAYKGAPTLEGQKAYLKKIVEESKGKSWYEYTKKTCKEYFEVLPHEQELWDELTEVRNEIYSSNIPIKHIYSLNKINE